MHPMHNDHPVRTYTGHFRATAIRQHTILILEPRDAIHMARASASACMTKIRYKSTLEPRLACKK